MAIPPSVLAAALANVGATPKQQRDDYTPLGLLKRGKDAVLPPKEGPDEYAAKPEDIQQQPEIPPENEGASSAIESGLRGFDVLDVSAPRQVIPVGPGGPRQDVAYGGGLAPSRIGGKQTFDTIEQAGQHAQQGIEEQAEAEKLIDQEQAKQMRDASIATQAQFWSDRADIHEARAEAAAHIKKLDAEAAAIAQTKIDQGRILRSPAGFFGAVIAAVTSAASGGRAGGPDVLNRAINADIEAQKTDLATRAGALNQRRGLLADYMRLTNDEEAATLLTQAKMKEFAAQKMSEVALRMRSPVTDAVAKQRIAQMMFEVNDLRARAYMMAYQNFQAMPRPVAQAIQAEQPGEYSVVTAGGKTTANTLGGKEAHPGSMEPVAPGSWVGGQGQSAPAGPAPVAPSRGAPAGVPGQAKAPAAPGPKNWASMKDPAFEDIFGTRRAEQVVSPPETDVIKGDSSLPRLASYPRTQRYLRATMAAQPVGKDIDGKIGIPGFSAVVNEKRALVLENAAIDSLNSQQGMALRRAGRTEEAEAKAAADAFAEADKVSKQAAASKEKIYKELAPAVMFTGAISDIRTNMRAVTQMMGEKRAQEFFNGVSGYGIQTLKDVHDKAHEVGSHFGLTDADAKRAMKLYIDLQFVNLIQRHEISGAAVNKEEKKQLENFLGPTMSWSSINEAVRFMSARQMDRTANAAAMAPSAQALLSFYAGYKASQGGGLPSAGVSGGSK